MIRTALAWLPALLLGVAALAPSAAVAHEIRPALLEIRESQAGVFELTWKVPIRGDRLLALEPVLPASFAPLGPPSERTVPGAYIRNATYRSESGLVGETIGIDGLSVMQTDVLVRIDLADGTSHSAILRPSDPSFLVPAEATRSEVAWSYSRMGVIHILDGIDHLLFLVAMLLLVAGFWALLKTITAFTLAHSVTLALATLGVVHVPAAPTEAIISLSIVFVALEIVRGQRGEASLTQQRPWTVAFAFGLFHGLGFAGALSEVGVPAREVPLALLMFNVGVEVGQVAFVTAVVLTLAALGRARLPGGAPLLRGPWQSVAAYGIGSLAVFWTIERVASFLPFGPKG